jgi:hypothetical protein
MKTSETQQWPSPNKEEAIVCRPFGSSFFWAPVLKTIVGRVVPRFCSAHL